MKLHRFLVAVLAILLSNIAAAEDGCYNLEGKYKDMQSFEKLESFGSAFNKNRAKKCLKTAYVGDDSLDRNGNLIVKIKCLDDGERRAFVVTRENFNSCTNQRKFGSRCQTMIECEELERRAQAQTRVDDVGKRTCEAQKKTCEASCQPYSAGANNDFHFSCTRKCGEITCN